MYLNSLNAIRALLVSSFPNVKTIYVDGVPKDFEQPSFFVYSTASGYEDLNASMVQFDIQWQVVYFPKLKKSGLPDVMDQLTVADSLFQAFAAHPYLVTPEGDVFHIMGYDGGPREDEIYMSIKLQSQFNRTKSTYEKMMDVHIEEG